MPHRTFLAFMGPSLLAMILFIALPIVSIVVQSLHVEHPAVMVTTETCQPFAACTTDTVVDAAATAALREAEPWGRFNGLGTYLDRGHLAVDEVARRLRRPRRARRRRSRGLCNLPLYRALAFTITYCLLVTPLAMALGFGIALAVNTVPRLLRGPVIFFSLVPMLITPLVGALILFWMVNSEGILGAAIQNLVNDPTLSLQSSAPLTWAMLIAYGTWTNAPFSFIVFFAGLQAVPQDTVEAAMIDGASRWERVRFVTIPSIRAADPVRPAGAADGQLPGLRADHLVQLGGAGDLARLPDLLLAQHADDPALRLGRRHHRHHHRLHRRADRAGPDARLARDDGEGLMAGRAPVSQADLPRAFRRPPLVMTVATGVVLLWLLVAAFPFAWTVWGSFKVQADFFSRDTWWHALLGPATTRVRRATPSPATATTAPGSPRGSGSRWSTRPSSRSSSPPSRSPSARSAATRWRGPPRATASGSCSRRCSSAPCPR